MDNQTALNEIYDTLSTIGVVDTKREFYIDWLNRSEGYLSALKHYDKQPSADALAICSSKLKHYSKLLQQKNNTKMIEIVHHKFLIRTKKRAVKTALFEFLFE